MNNYEQIILGYYHECEEALETAEKEYDLNKKSSEKRRIKEYCFAQVMAMEDLMSRLDIDFDDLDDGEDEEE